MPQNPAPPPVTFTQLADMYGRLRKDFPPSFGSYTELGDPNKIAPANFPVARSTPIHWDNLYPGIYGTYGPEASKAQQELATQADREKYKDLFINKIHKSSLPAVFRVKDHNSSETDQLLGAIITPHETGHAVYHELPENTPSWLYERDNGVKQNWNDLHYKHLANNKALGNYQYANDPSHSFADAFATWVVNPAMLKNTFPEIYDYFGRLAYPKPPAPKF